MEEVILFSSKKEMEKALAQQEVLTIQVGMVKYNMTRVGNEVYVFEQKCPHFDHSLANAKVSPYGKITCLWHNYKFDLQSGEESEERCRSLVTHQAEWTDDGQLMVKL